MAYDDYVKDMFDAIDAACVPTTHKATARILDRMAVIAVRRVVRRAMPEVGKNPQLVDLGPYESGPTIPSRDEKTGADWTGD